MLSLIMLFFFFNDTATTEIYTLSLHDALPIWFRGRDGGLPATELALHGPESGEPRQAGGPGQRRRRSEEHTSELQSHVNLVCRLLLEKKKKKKNTRKPHRTLSLTSTRHT